MTIATVKDLREMLEQFDDDAPIRIAEQPSWPLRLPLQDVRIVEPDEDDEPDPTATEEEQRDARIVWLVAGSSPHNESPYAPRAVFEF